MRTAVVLFNLGGPDSLDAVEPFLRNLFSDRAIVALPAFARLPLARFIAARRAPVARKIYAEIGGRSPILEETEIQARALELALTGRDVEARVFVAMRCWKPFSDETAQIVAAWKPDKCVLLPLYPQYSTTTSASSLMAWERAAKRVGLSMPQRRICCYPRAQGFIAAEAELIKQAFAKRKPNLKYRLLLSAHGLPKRIIARGDPYQWQIESSAAAIIAGLDMETLDWNICYQSRVGPMKWIGPATDAEVRRAGSDGKGLIIAPIAFVSEHSETFVELDIEYARLATESGVPDFIRVPTVGTRPQFIEGLTQLVVRAANGEDLVTDCGGRNCPARFGGCGYGEEKQ